MHLAYAGVFSQLGKGDRNCRVICLLDMSLNVSRLADTTEGSPLSPWSSSQDQGYITVQQGSLYCYTILCFSEVTFVD
jgi:hypothetical protein